MPCPYCEAPLAEEYAACPECGKSLVGVRTSSQPQMPAVGTPAQRPVNPQQQRLQAQARQRQLQQAQRQQQAQKLRQQQAQRQQSQRQPQQAQRQPQQAQRQPQQPQQAQRQPQQPQQAQRQPQQGQPQQAQRQPQQGQPQQAQRRPQQAPRQSQRQHPGQQQRSDVPPDESMRGLVEHNSPPDDIQVDAQPLPGLIDARLFGAYVPEHIAVDTMDGLEPNAAEVGEVRTEVVPGLEVTRFDDLTAQTAGTDETVPGLIDSRLFGAYVPQDLETPTAEGIEPTELEPHRVPAAAQQGEDHAGPKIGYCPACGTKTLGDLCSDCGGPLIFRELDE